MVTVRNITPNTYFIKFSDGNRKTLRPFKSLVLSDNDYRLAEDYILKLEKENKVCLDFKPDEVIDTARDVLAVIGSEALNISEAYRMSSMAFLTSQNIASMIKLVNGKFMVKYNDTYVSTDRRTFVFYKNGHCENAFLIPLGYGSDLRLNGFYVTSKFAVLAIGYSLNEYSAGSEIRLLVNDSLIYTLIVNNNQAYYDNLFVTVGYDGILTVFVEGSVSNLVLYLEVSDTV